MFGTRLRPAPYVSLRHVREGVLGETGRLPAGWEGEHTETVMVVATDSSDAHPWVTVEFTFDGTPRSAFAGLSIGHFLSAPKDAVVAMTVEVTLEAWENVGAAMLMMREWRHGGQFMSQTKRELSLGGAPQLGLVAHQVTGRGRVVQPFLLARRDAAGSHGRLTATLRGAAFGDLYEHPRWLWH